MVNGSFAIYVRWLFGWRYISSLHSADEPQEGRNSCPLLRSYFIGSCHVGVSKRFSRSISPAVYTVYCPSFRNKSTSSLMLTDQATFVSIYTVYKRRCGALSTAFNPASSYTLRVCVCFLNLNNVLASFQNMRTQNTIGANRPFYSCRLSDLASEWQRGWS